MPLALLREQFERKQETLKAEGLQPRTLQQELQQVAIVLSLLQTVGFVDGAIFGWSNRDLVLLLSLAGWAVVE